MSDRLSAALIANQTFFNALPSAVREEVKDTLAKLGQDILTAQQSMVPVYAGKPRKGVVPGRLKAALNVAEATDFLRVRVGYPQLRGRRSKLFYAIIMEYGRQAREVPMRRLKRGARSEWLARIRGGSARAGQKPDDLLDRKTTMRVGAIAPRPFVHLDDRFAIAIDAAVADFWDKVEARV